MIRLESHRQGNRVGCYVVLVMVDAEARDRPDLPALRWDIAFPNAPCALRSSRLLCALNPSNAFE